MDPVIEALMIALLVVILFGIFRLVSASIAYLIDEIDYRLYDRKRKKKEYLERIKNLTDKLSS